VSRKYCPRAQIAFATETREHLAKVDWTSLFKPGHSSSHLDQTAQKLQTASNSRYIATFFVKFVLEVYSALSTVQGGLVEPWVGDLLLLAD
jgi:hypothetical protein